MRKALMLSSFLLLLALVLAFVDERSRGDGDRKAPAGSGRDAGPWHPTYGRGPSPEDEVDPVRAKYSEAHLEAEVMMNMWQDATSNPTDAIRALRELRKRRHGETAVEVSKRIVTSDKAQVDVLRYAADLLAWREGEASVGYLVDAMQHNPKKWAIFSAALVISAKNNKALCDTAANALISVRDSGRVSDISRLDTSIKGFERCQYDPGNPYSPEGR